MEQTSGKLYLVPTPIGNLGDITFRAVDTLKQVDVILAEDTRTSGFLLKHYDVRTPMESYHAHNEHKKVDQIVSRLKSGSSLALITDAGTPGISDPGFLLARAALENDLEIEALPGATAFVPALIKSGFPTDRFVFEGFLPQKKGRKTRLDQLAAEHRTQVLYESPHRIMKLLAELKEVMPNRLVSVSRELTKKFEETKTGIPAELEAHFDAKQGIKGEFVVVIAANG
jgi:16S rRNA (cytidine1402-2'-O)-methyltransferase